jgi:hypothetical protein
MTKLKKFWYRVLALAVLAPLAVAAWAVTPSAIDWVNATNITRHLNPNWFQSEVRVDGLLTGTDAIFTGDVDVDGTLTGSGLSAIMSALQVYDVDTPAFGEFTVGPTGAAQIADIRYFTGELAPNDASSIAISAPGVTSAHVPLPRNLVAGVGAYILSAASTEDTVTVTFDKDVDTTTTVDGFAILLAE